MALDVDAYTAQLVPDTKTTVTNQYFDLNAPFAVPRYGNQCTPYICGRDYMQAVADAIKKAAHFIFIADWQLDYDVELEKRGIAGHPGRLSELLADALLRGVHVRVLCYDSMDMLSKFGPPDTHEEKTQKMLEAMPQGKGSIEVAIQNPSTQRTPNPFNLGSNVNFAHHQKFVVVDGKVAFVGGIDLAYGRWETPAFDVAVDPNLHVINDGYNMQVLAARTPSKAENDLLQDQANKRPGFAPSYYPDGKLLDPATQPRQPWNDVAVGITGPAAYDVFVNFVLRWNSFAKGFTTNFLTNSALSIDWFENKAKGQETLVDPLANGPGQATVQICRSASSAQLGLELDLWNGAKKYIHDDWKQPNPVRRTVMQAARKAWASNHQTSIHDAMVNCIRAAQAYIYIENQFFISDCGSDVRGTPHPANNQIIAELANAIGQAIHADRPFHVWLVLPEHAEGMLEADATASQAWWALQGIKHGSSSLINRINATVLKKNQKKWGIDKPIKTNQDILNILKTKGMENKWREYLTVLNVRNYGQSAKGVVTEMIYVHSKLTIVDDAVAIIGSANINDRSLTGNGDTELAAIIVDNANAQLTDLGQGVKAVTRKFAQDLRMQLWKKHFGMLIDTPTTGVQKEGAPPLGINIEKPLDAASIKGIQTLASNNRAAYNRVFTHTPRNEFGTLQEGRKKYPPLMKKVKKYEVNGTPIGGVSPDGRMRDPYILAEEPDGDQRDFSKMPALQTAYMLNSSQHNISQAITELRNTVKGFFVEMPLNWGLKETTSPKPPRNDGSLIAGNLTYRRINNV